MEPPLVPQVLLQHGLFVRRLAHGLLGDAHAAEDVTQEAWTRYLERPPAEDRGLQAWLRTVIKNHVVNLHRSASRRVDRERLSARPEAIDGAVEELELSETLRAVVEAVLALEEPYRETILARYWRGLDAAEVAAECGASAATVRSREKRALEKLRARLDRESGGERGVWALALVRVVRPSGAQADPSGPAPSGTAMRVFLALGLVVTLALGGWWAHSSPGRAGTTPPREFLSASASDSDPGSNSQRAKEGVGLVAREPATGAETLALAESAETFPVRGVLRHSRDGRPMAGVVLAFHNDAHLGSEADERPVEVETDDEGRFRVALPQGIFRSDIPSSPDSSIFPPIQPLFSTPTGTEEELELRYMDPDAWMEVRVVAGGLPFGGAKIEGYLQTYYGRMELGGTADPDGQLTIGFPKVGPTTKLGLIAFGPGTELISAPVTVSERPPADPIVLELELPTTLRVQARYASGGPVRDGYLDALYEGGAVWPGSHWASTRADALGAANLSLPAGRYTISLDDPASTLIEKELELDWGADMDLEFLFPDAPLAIQGSVVDERDEPLAYVSMQVDRSGVLLDADTCLGQPTSGADGRFEFRMSGTGVLRVSAEWDMLGDRFEPPAVDVPFGTRDIRFRRVDSRPLSRLQIEVVEGDSLQRLRFVQPMLLRPSKNFSLTSPIFGGLGTIDVKGYSDVLLQFRAVGYRTHSVPVVDLLARRGLQRVALEPGFRGVVVVLGDEGDYPPIVGASAMDGDECLGTSDMNGRIVLDLDHWPETVRFLAPGHESTVWPQKRWLIAYEGSSVLLKPLKQGQSR